MEFKISILALLVSFFTLIAVALQAKLLRKEIQVQTYQSLIERVFVSREILIKTPGIWSMFAEHPDLKPLLQRHNMSIQEFFWVLNYLTAWENFFYQRRNGVMTDQTWVAYIQTIKFIFKSEKIRGFWGDYKEFGTYRKDWVNFVDAVCRGGELEDPILPRWKRAARAFLAN